MTFALVTLSSLLEENNGALCDELVAGDSVLHRCHNGHDGYVSVTKGGNYLLSRNQACTNGADDQAATFGLKYALWCNLFGGPGI